MIFKLFFSVVFLLQLEKVSFGDVAEPNYHEPVCQIARAESDESGIRAPLVWVSTRMTVPGCQSSIARCSMTYECSFPDNWGEPFTGQAECMANLDSKTCPSLSACMDENMETGMHHTSIQSNPAVSAQDRASETAGSAR